MNYKEENEALIDSFMKRTYYRAYKEGAETKLQNWRNFEFILNYDCNLGCRYCYGNRYGHELCPEGTTNDEDIMKNVDIVLDWFFENGFDPKIEIFAGDAMVQDIGYWTVERILDRGKGKLTGPVVIPTNYTFILNEKLTKKAENLIQKGRDNGIYVSFSASFDGKYCEANRPFIGMIDDAWMDKRRIWHWKMNDVKDPRDDEYYDKCFAFAKKHYFGFHPMVYSYTIENWQKNFLWFQSKFREFEIPWDNIYLLEVRNIEWTKKQVEDFGEFIKFLIKWSYDKVGRVPENYLNFLFKGKGFNILTSPLTTIGRGIGCSMQSDIYCRMGDLAIASCHRTSYDPLNLGHFKVEDGKITGVEVKNPELFLATRTFTTRSLPYCERCPLQLLCSSGCLGSQYETTGDVFTPIPSVCRLEHEKIKSMIEAYKELNLWEIVLGRLGDDKKAAILLIEELMSNEE